MKMTVFNQIPRAIIALAVLLMLSSMPLLGQNQNQLTNGDFEASNDYIEYTDYQRTFSPYVVEAGHYAIDNTTNGYGGGQGWPFPSNSHGKFMMVNGYGGNNNASKVVWRQTVTVIDHTIYTLSFRVANLNQVYYGQIYPAKMQVKINGIDQFSTPYQLPSNNNWQDKSLSWNSGNSTSAIIEIFDVCNNNSGLGDDFCLDDIVFKLDDGYSLTANDFTENICADTDPPFEIDLTGHYTITYPSGGNAAPPMQVKIRKNSGQPWETSITTNHGSAYVGSDNKIYYTPNAGYYGPDDFRYQISRFGLESHKRIDIIVGDVPTNCTPQGLPADSLLCINNVSSFNPSATWSNNGSDFTSPPGWQFKKVGVTDWQDSYTFQNYVQNYGGIGIYSIKFYATNACGTSESIYTFSICNSPEWNPAPNVNTICTGSAEPTFGINWNFNSGVQTWRYKRGNGNWTNFVWGDFALQPGDQVRYTVIADACGGSLTSMVINVVSGPEFNSSIPVSFDEGYCPGTQVSLPAIQSSWYNAYGMSVTSSWYYVNYDPSGSPTYVPINGNTITLGTESVSVTPGLQNTECGFTPFFPAFDLIVYEAPAIQGLDALPDSLGPVCSGTALGSILPELSPDGYYTDYGWEISAGQNPSGFQSNLPQNLSVTDNGRWLRYRVEGCSQYGDVTSDPIRVWVGDKPTLNTAQIDPLGTVCAGTSVASLVDVHVTNWNLFDDPDDCFERWEVYLNDWTEFTQFELNHNGHEVRYHAHNQCGDVIVSAGVVTVTEGPSFNNPGAQLPFNPYYCDGDVLELPAYPAYNNHGINVSDEYWAYFDGTELHQITSAPQLNESWNGYQITYVLISDCGGEISYPTPFTLIVKGNPEVEITLEGSNTFCAGTPLALDTVIDWHLCTENTQESSWQYAPSNQPGSYSDFDPIVGIPEAGTFLVTYHAVAYECGFEAYGNLLSVTVEAAPAFENEVPFELSRYCEDEVLQLPSNPVVTGHVDEAGWQISVGTDQFGEYTEIVSGHVLTLEDNGRWLRYYVLGCNVPIHYDVEIHVDGKPWEEYSIVERICKGQTISYQLINTNGYPVTENDWRIGSITGNSFNPDDYIFDEEGDYLIYYRVGNDCGWSDYEGPLSLSVTAGPEFDNSALPTEAQYVCEGTTVGEFLQQLGITEPPLIDPTINHEPLGWFINGISVDLSLVIVEGFHDAQLSYGVSGDCSDIPVYSSGILLYVYGTPEVTQMPSLDWEFCDGDAVQLSDPEIDYHNGEGHVTGSWQILSSDGSWGDLPDTWSVENNGAQIHYHLEHDVCSSLFSDSQPLTITVYSAPSVNDDEFPASGTVTICSGGSLGINEPSVDWHQSPAGDEGWQVSANGQDWFTELNGHVFNPNNVDDFFDGKYLRYHAESIQCPNLEDNSETLVIQLIETPFVNDAGWPEQVSYCSGGSLGIDEPEGLPGEWQVSVDGTNWVTELEGHAFDPNHVEDFFDGMFLRYFVHSSCGDAASKALKLAAYNSEHVGTISGSAQVYVASNLISGIYRYDIDATGIVGDVEWSLTNPDWLIVEATNTYCRIFVGTAGTATLKASFGVADCGEMERTFDINAGFFDVNDYQLVEVNVFPNPTKGAVTIESEGIESIRITDMMGQVLELRECDRSDSVVLSLASYVPSVYLLEIKTVNGIVKKRIVLCR